jgi:hypothetical protein
VLTERIKNICWRHVLKLQDLLGHTASVLCNNTGVEASGRKCDVDPHRKKDGDIIFILGYVLYYTISLVATDQADVMAE